jgi:hypothetical protein
MRSNADLCVQDELKKKMMDIGVSSNIKLQNYIDDNNNLEIDKLIETLSLMKG